MTITHSREDAYTVTRLYRGQGGGTSSINASGALWDTLPEVGDYILFGQMPLAGGHAHRGLVFNSLTPPVFSGGTVTGVWEYPHRDEFFGDYSTLTDDHWRAVSLVNDTTNGLTQAGGVEWQTPEDWTFYGKYLPNVYYNYVCRFRVTGVTATGMTSGGSLGANPYIKSNDIYVDGQTVTLDDLVAATPHITKDGNVYTLKGYLKTSSSGVIQENSAKAKTLVVADGSVVRVESPCKYGHIYAPFTILLNSKFNKGFGYQNQFYGHGSEHSYLSIFSTVDVQTQGIGSYLASFDNLTTNIPVSVGTYPVQNTDVLRQYFEGAKAPIRNVSSTGISVVYVFDVASDPTYYDLMQKDPSRHIVYARRLSNKTAKVIGYNKENNDNLTYFHAQSTNATVEYGWQIVSPLQDLQGNALTDVTVSIESENVTHVLNNGWLAQAEGTLTAVNGLTISDSANSKTAEQISWRKIRMVSGEAVGEENIIQSDQSGTDWEVAFDWDTAPEVGDKYVILPHQITQSDSNVTGSAVTTTHPAQKTRVVKYGYKTRDLDLVLDSHYQLPTQLLADEKITEADKSIVEAYTILDTPQKLYDYFRYWLTNPVNINHGDCLDIAGETITTDYNVRVDPDAIAPFAFDGTTLTIKADIFTGNITTTETITLANDATVAGARTDSTGVKAAFTLTVSDVLVGSRVALMDDAGDIIHGANAINSTFRYTFPEGYTGDLTWAVYKEGYTATVGSSNIKAGQTSFEATATQTLMQNSRGDMYAGQGGGDISITYDDFSGWAIVKHSNSDAGMEYKWTAQAFIDAFCDFIATTDGMKWLLKHGADAVPQFLYGSAGLQEIVVKAGTVACDGDGNKITVEAYCRDAMNITTKGSFTWEGAAAAELSAADRQIMQSTNDHSRAANLQTQRAG